MRTEFAARLYALSLGFYPRSLRSEFADEMTLVFEEQLAEAAGVLGVLRLWASVISDIFRVALPARMAPIVVPALAIAMALVWYVGVLGLIPLTRAR